AVVVVDGGQHLVADVDLTVDDLHAVSGQPLDRVLHVGDTGGEAVTGDQSDIGSLPAGFRVEGSAVEDHIGALTGREHFGGDPVGDDAADAGIGFEPVVADERSEERRVGKECSAGAAAAASQITS